MEKIIQPLFLISIVFFTIGILLLFFPPKKINIFYGYRTSQSMKNKESWKLAQHYSSILIIKLSVLLFLCSLIGLFYEFKSETKLTISLLFLAFFVVVIFFKTEKTLKKVKK